MIEIEKQLIKIYELGYLHGVTNNKELKRAVQHDIDEAKEVILSAVAKGNKVVLPEMPNDRFVKWEQIGWTEYEQELLRLNPWIKEQDSTNQYKNVNMSTEAERKWLSSELD